MYSQPRLCVGISKAAVNLLMLLKLNVIACVLVKNNTFLDVPSIPNGMSSTSPAEAIKRV